VAIFCWPAWAAAVEKELDVAAQVLPNMTSSNQMRSYLLSRAKCIAVIPDLTKAALIGGGKHGGGAVSRQTAGRGARLLLSP